MNLIAGASLLVVVVDAAVLLIHDDDRDESDLLSLVFAVFAPKAGNVDVAHDVLFNSVVVFSFDNPDPNPNPVKRGAGAAEVEPCGAALRSGWWLFSEDIAKLELRVEEARALEDVGKEKEGKVDDEDEVFAGAWTGADTGTFVPVD